MVAAIVSSWPAGKRLRLGMVGGGPGAFIGAVHRMAAALDNRWTLIAGALSADAARAEASAADWGLERSYGDFREMARAEAARPDGIDAVAIVTPNHLHAPVAEAFLEVGIDVICDRPLTATMAEARRLVATVRRTDRVFVLTYNNTGHALIRQAAAMVRAGALGRLRQVQVEYVQDWLATPLEKTGHKQAEWRLDPARSGAGGCIADIGTHAFNLAAYVSGLETQEVSAELTSFVQGRPLDDTANLLLRYDQGVRGMLWATQSAPGNENALRLRIYGEKAGLEWAQEQSNQLVFKPLGAPSQLLTRGGPGLSQEAAHATRLPPGHPEGYPEAFATIYADAAELIAAQREGRRPDPLAASVPNVIDGARAMAFVEAAVESSRRGGVWTSARFIE
jgi:predicted dehydrogenase